MTFPNESTAPTKLEAVRRKGAEREREGRVKGGKVISRKKEKKEKRALTAKHPN
jgi:hypothetical protein